MHELRLVRQAPEGVSENGGALSGLHDTQIDLLIVETFVFLTVSRGRAHKDSARNPAGRGIPVQVRR
ncbi:MAG: hypothetical protein WDN46_25725 [Methylocella sp.]